MILLKKKGEKKENLWQDKVLAHTLVHCVPAYGVRTVYVCEELANVRQNI